jgi:hypothetical protein
MAVIELPNTDPPIIKAITLKHKGIKMIADKFMVKGLVVD